jgi:hypothetical protein
LDLSNEKLVSKIVFKLNLYRYMAGFADGYIRMFERRGDDDDDEHEVDEEEDDGDERDRERDGEGDHGRKGNGGGGGDRGDTRNNNHINNSYNGWYLREPCPTRAAHMARPGGGGVGYQPNAWRDYCYLVIQPRDCLTVE